MNKHQLIQLSTVHPRNDIRIFVKQVQTLHAALDADVALVVADGLGDSLGTGSANVHDLGKLPESRLLRAIHGNKRAFDFIRRTKPRLVHFHDPELIPLGLVLRVFGHEVIYDVHEDVPRQIMSKHWIPVVLRWPVAKAISAMEWLAGRFFNGIVPATSTIAARFPLERTVLVQNFPIQSELVLATPQPYNQRPQAFAYVGALTDIRGVKGMVQALDHLKDRPDAHLEIAGAISPAGLAAELRELSSWSRVRYRQSLNRSEVAQLLGGARGGLVLFHPMPNHIDAQPNKMFEYMSAGLPVVASDFPLWREIIDGAKCGLLVDPLNPKAIADAMRWILDHPEQAEAMGRNGQAAVRNKYNWDRESKTLIDFYRTLLKSKN